MDGKSVLKEWIREFCSFFVFLRYGDLWGLYRHLYEKSQTSGFLTGIFVHCAEKRGGYIGIGAKFGNRPCFPHGLQGVFISKDAEIGKDAVIFHGVTVGAVHTEGSRSCGSPKIGDNCYIGAGAKIIGNITIGNNCRIGANAVVYSDMPDNSTALCSETRIITKDTAPDNRFYVYENGKAVRYWANGKFVSTESASGGQKLF